jgi:hypothetical protein
MSKEQTRPFRELAAPHSGILWAINRYLFHPRGFALAIDVNERGEATGWMIQGDGSEPWVFKEEDDDACFTMFEELLATLSKAREVTMSEQEQKVEVDEADNVNVSQPSDDQSGSSEEASSPETGETAK